MKFLDNLKDFFMPSEEEYMDNPEPSSQDLDQEPPMRNLLLGRMHREKSARATVH